MMRKSKFVYDGQEDGYRCPQGQLLVYATTDRKTPPKNDGICQQPVRSRVSGIVFSLEVASLSPPGFIHRKRAA